MELLGQGRRDGDGRRGEPRQPGQQQPVLRAVPARRASRITGFYQRRQRPRPVGADRPAGLGDLRPLRAATTTTTRASTASASPPPRPPVQMEAEDNDSTGNADASRASPGERLAPDRSVAGYIALNDGGDYFFLGNLDAGTTISLSTRDSVLEHPGPQGRDPDRLDRPARRRRRPEQRCGDGDGHRRWRAYYARLTAKSGAGLLAQYLLDIELTDATAPVITVDEPAGWKARRATRSSTGSRSASREDMIPPPSTTRPTSTCGSAGPDGRSTRPTT